MIMDMRHTTAIIIAITAATLLGGVLAYPHLPATIASHWNIHGEANGSLDRFWGIFIFPIVQLFLLFIYLIIPKIDPLRANIPAFRKSYDAFWIFLVVFFAYMAGLSLAWNLGFTFNFLHAVLPALSLLLFTIGRTAMHARQNWFFGIRTPWTLASEAVWDKTHAFGGRLFQYVSWIPLVGFFTADHRVLHAVILLPTLGSAVAAFIYSYLVYRTESRR
jgi:uncharacterized membrane protein